MYAALCIVAIIQWSLFIYIPVVAFYGIMRMMIQPDVTNTLCSPFLGIKKVSLKSGLIIWMVQTVFLGVVLYDLYQWFHFGINPLIRIW